MNDKDPFSATTICNYTSYISIFLLIQCPFYAICIIALLCVMTPIFAIILIFFALGTLVLLVMGHYPDSFPILEPEKFCTPSNISEYPLLTIAGHKLYPIYGIPLAAATFLILNPQWIAAWIIVILTSVVTMTLVFIQLRAWLMNLGGSIPTPTVDRGFIREWIRAKKQKICPTIKFVKPKETSISS